MNYYDIWLLKIRIKKLKCYRVVCYFRYIDFCYLELLLLYGYIKIYEINEWIYIIFLLFFLFMFFLVNLVLVKSDFMFEINFKVIINIIEDMMKFKIRGYIIL